MIIEVNGLRKSYGPVEAVRGIDLAVERGSFFAFLGLNGAGKSTTINCLTTLLEADFGEVEIAGGRLGHDDEAIRQAIGVVFQAPLLDPLLTVRENLALRARFHRQSKDDFTDRLTGLSRLLSLDDVLDRRYGKLSGGQRRRADIARALLHKPEILFLDEPTAGLDPHGRAQVWQAVMDIRNSQGMTVFLTTHYMAETEQADQVSIIDAGQIVAQGTPADLRQRHSASRLTVRLWRRAAARARLAEVGRQVPLGYVAQEPLVFDVASATEARAILGALGDEVMDFEFRHGSMDDVFLSLTEHAAPAPSWQAEKQQTGRVFRSDSSSWGEDG
ncbi:MAG: ABC transporter ATP-binding protein [Propionibacteriaceae bacterium]|jgi:multidrug/hemolysin transport system ATP-binding protein|nr:ABC transporter ATP-binding protein [Propionibacteriaceae bacterium]